MKIDSRLKKVKVQATFLSWKSFTILFWVEFTEEIFVASHNKYLFSYTTDVTDSSHHPNQFSLGLQGRTPRWRFVLKGNDSKNFTEITFSSGQNLLGWRLVSIRWDQASRKLDFAIDVGHVFRDDSHQIPSSHWPEEKNGHLFHLGGWQDNWDGGLSELKFFNFLVFQKWLSNADLETVFNKERPLLRSL